VDKVVHEPGYADDVQQEADRLECLLHGSYARDAAQTGASRGGTARGDFGTDAAQPAAPKVSGWRDLPGHPSAAANGPRPARYCLEI
jgi:hypothetical protein